MKRLISIIIIGVVLLSLTACGGLHNSRAIYAKNLITGENLKIDLKVTEYADTGNFSNFTVNLDYDELMDKLLQKGNINGVTGLSSEYIKLDTDSGEFYIKCNSNDTESDSYTYSLFADVGKVSSLSQNVYIPFHLFEHYEHYNYPATATPFEGDVTYDSELYDISDFAQYYEDKGIYTVEQRAEGTILKMTDNDTGYRFVLELFPQQELVLLHKADEEE